MFQASFLCRLPVVVLVPINVDPGTQPIGYGRKISDIFSYG